MATLTDEKFDVDKISYEIFSILESQFLFSASPPETPLKPLADVPGKVRILSIDAAGDGGVLAALSLCRLEDQLKKQSGDPAASVADYFDLAAGSGVGGVLAAMLFTRGQDRRSLFSAEESLRFLSSKSKNTWNKNGILRKVFRRSDNKLKAMFSDATLRDATKPVLISCFDMLTGSPFMFSRSDAVESDGFDFLMKEICAATCADRPVEVTSVDGKTRIKAVGGAMGMGNPTAAAITHVLNNKREFPFADGPEDLLVISLGSGEAVNCVDGNGKLAAKIAKMVGEGATNMVDQSVAMAFGRSSSTNYVRIQANGLVSETKHQTDQCPVSAAEIVLSQKHMESVMFRGKKISEQNNGERIESMVGELVQEQERRKSSTLPTVLIKPAVASARASSATTITVASSSPISLC